MAGPFLAGLVTVLGHADGHTAQMARQRVWSALIADSTPYNFGARARVEFADLPWSIVEVGLSSIAPQQPPRVVGGSDRDRPLDRAVVDRVRATLRRAMDRDELPDIPLLCAEEVDRSCAPWGLLAEDKQATLVAGIDIAVDLAPLRDVGRATVRPRQADPGPAAQGGLRPARAALPGRRCRAASPATSGDRRPRRLCAPVYQPIVGTSAWTRRVAGVVRRRRRRASVLEGVARSVSLDHRQRIKAMLEIEVAQ